MLLPQLFLTFATKITWGSQTFVQLLTLTSVLLFTSYKVSTSDTPQPTEGEYVVSNTATTVLRVRNWGL